MFLLAAIHAVATVMMAGLIWFVQLVHYPMFLLVGEHEFKQYEKQHVRRTTWIVAPLMMIETITAMGLLFLTWGSGYGALTVPGVLLLVLIWVSTAFVQVPCHKRLDRGFDPAAAHRLVWTNWIRTVAWSVRLVLAMLLLQAIAS